MQICYHLNMNSKNGLSEQEQAKIRRAFPISDIAISKDIYRCPLCGGKVRITDIRSQGKALIVRCSQCNLKGILSNSRIQFTGREPPCSMRKKTPSTSNKERGIPDIDFSKMSDQEFYEYIAKHKGNSKRILSKDEHRKLLTKHSKPSGRWRGTYHKSGSAKLWS